MPEIPGMIPGVPSRIEGTGRPLDYTNEDLQAQDKLKKRKEKRSEAPEHEASVRPQAPRFVGTSPDHLPIVAGDPLLN
jgi:hypothetical protein